LAAQTEERRVPPLLFDFPRPEAKTYTDTIRTLAGLARFVVVDLSGPSVPQEITATVDLYEIPFVPILEQRRQLFRRGVGGVALAGVGGDRGRQPDDRFLWHVRRRSRGFPATRCSRCAPGWVAALLGNESTAPLSHSGHSKEGSI